MIAALAGDFTVTPHHLQCVRRVHNIDANPVYCYHGKFSSPTYSQTIVDWLIERHKDEPQFFENCKTAAKRSTRQSMTSTILCCCGWPNTCAGKV